MTDGTYIQQRPSQALLQKKVNGLRHLAGVSNFISGAVSQLTIEKNNANEGNIFVIAGITTEIDLVAWVNQTFFMLSSTEQSKLLDYYSFITSPQEIAYVSSAIE